MKPINKQMLILIFVLGTGGCDSKDTRLYSGYSHGDFIYLSASSTEKIDRLLVKKGERVVAGQALVEMEKFTAANARQRAEKNYQAEKALLVNLNSGDRPQELDVIRSQLERAHSAADRAQRQLERYRKLYAARMVSAAEWENIKDDHAQKNAQVKELANQLKAKQLPARQAEIKHQASRVAAAKLQWDQAEWDLQQSTLIAPQDAYVYDVLYRQGERPVGGKPIISLLPDDNIKIRFFVPESQLGNLYPGMKAQLSCDNCNENILAAINYISPEAEYSPPVIYSTRRREKLLFMVEAVPASAQAGLIKIGQPFNVEILTDE
ncbi:HlyD family secretion protein [Cedecea colo]|uniref:HlyD family efflux transporter periplasmic adaptor subunit n=1 Tax=Cedecea colo TaxID=2552946 RepID=A0ABX0VIE9_9ENTR|nr:HlyD family efflux transporter periplasmic adaptor subunit [Cedecea colo]NIY46150.1 HlyD family efflux transporter periplasmic adaptor subunit [Cedecea colo]